ncbi:unnamed protein product [Didymodactylos carnosus]|uniref:Acetyl-coenzyme A transporter 1 n=1 Tax=Didymodactylos carnosus TaxID=1234261 RepID=A0A814FVA4_9BILA|nr:unnamed protein product [Didymodactylos carnosus]CAF3758564.1 unnamed protein product [Didymodactylos carnosus]
MASQDICVDAWSLHLLNFIDDENNNKEGKRNYLGWQSTCNTVGQASGVFTGMSLLLMLESHNFCNKYIRPIFSFKDQAYGLIKFSNFLLFWGIIFIIVTCSIALFCREPEGSNDDRGKEGVEHFTIKETYLSVVKLYRRSSMWHLTFILLTFSMGFAATASMTHLKLIEHGITKETIGLTAIPLILIQITVPFSVTRSTTSRKPLNLFIYSYIPRLIMSLVVLILIYLTPLFHIAETVKFHWYYYLVLVLILSLNEALTSAMFVSRQAFFAQIADPRIGGTYLTLLNTLANFSFLSFNSINLFIAGRISKIKSLTAKLDTYTLMVICCTVLGVLWFVLTYRAMIRLQKISIEKWHLEKNKKFSDADIDNKEERDGELVSLSVSPITA